MKPRILVVGQLPPPHHGSNLMTEMFVHSLKKNGCDIVVIEKTFSKKIEDVRRLTISKILKIPIITAIFIKKLFENKYDLCFYFLSKKPPSIYIDTFFLFLLRLFHIKYVLYMHAKGVKDLGNFIPCPLLTIVENEISRSLGAFVLGERLKTDLNHLIPDENLFVLPNAVSDTAFIKNSDINTVDQPVNILFLSNLMPSKGPMEFLIAAKRIVSVNKNIHFYLAGPKMSDLHFRELTEFIKNERLNDFITMTGPIYGHEKETLFAKNDIFVFPTKDEAFGLVNLEAMRAGVPIVSTNEGSIPEVVLNGINGFIVEPGDIEELTERVLLLINDSKLRKKMGNAGREIYVKKYTIDSYIKNLNIGVKYFLSLKT